VAHTAALTRVDVSLLLLAPLTYRIDETFAESVDKAGGRYEVAVTGEGGRDPPIRIRIGPGLCARVRWAPLRTQSFFFREGGGSSSLQRSQVRLPLATGPTITSRARHSFFRRLRVVDRYRPRMPEGRPQSTNAIKRDAQLPADKLWAGPQSDGNLSTHNHPRRKGSPATEGPDDVSKRDTRPSWFPFTLKRPRVGRGLRAKPGGAIRSSSRFSSWGEARIKPAQITFGVDRRPETPEYSDDARDLPSRSA